MKRPPLSERHPWVKYLSLIGMAAAIYAGAVWISWSLLVALAWGMVIAIAVRPIHRKLGNFIGAKLSAISLISITCLFFVALTGVAGYGAVTEVSTLAQQIRSFTNTQDTSGQKQDTASDQNAALGQNSQDPAPADTSDQNEAQDTAPADHPAAKSAPALPDAISEPMHKVISLLPPSLAAKINPEQIKETAIKQARSMSRIAGLAALKVVKEIPHLMETFFIAMLTAACCLLSYDRVTASMRNVSMELTQRDDILLHIVRSVRGAVNGLVLVGIGEALVCSPLIFAADVRHAVILTFVLAIAASIPFCGYPGAILIGGIIAASGALNMGLAVAAFGIFVLFCGEHFVRPKFISDETRLPFLHTMVAILGGLHMLGLVGLFIGPAILAAAYMLWCELDGSRETTETSDQNLPTR
ncbi:AI-2E family transporter [Acetobacter sp. AN02]|uniref:AI-2E family transporter n=1 Tax=Acetobacter sp. AN02 TaxID=2894186 RepID=UPI0024343191|nr:AI-2E family transporter [Acetobacter sp. AN02]MDG6095199.1 AI-2E family transporter [Acetobacter sp. AN02]